MVMHRSDCAKGQLDIALTQKSTLPGSLGELRLHDYCRLQGTGEGRLPSQLRS